MRRATHAATIGFAAMLAFQVALAAGAPLGHAAWGGTHTQPSTAQRVGSAISVAFYALAIVVVRRRASGRDGRYSWATLGLVGILGLSALMNAASSSPWERYLLAPVALALAVLCAVVAYGARRSTARPSDDRPVATSWRGSGTAAARHVARLGGTR
jgi:peptidoglycan/LPS O-acetylase OafA/YrhL